MVVVITGMAEYHQTVLGHSYVNVIYPQLVILLTSKSIRPTREMLVRLRLRIPSLTFVALFLVLFVFDSLLAHILSR